MNNDTIKQIEAILGFMNEEPSKLFGGKYNRFGFDKEKIHAINWDKDAIGEFVTYYTSNDIRLLHQLAMAKWGDASLCYTCVDKSSFDIDDEGNLWCTHCNNYHAIDSESNYYLTKWVLIEDESDRIAQIYQDIK